jgi:hypothetical protein
MISPCNSLLPHSSTFIIVVAGVNKKTSALCAHVFFVSSLCPLSTKTHHTTWSHLSSIILLFVIIFAHPPAFKLLLVVWVPSPIRRHSRQQPSCYSVHLLAFQTPSGNLRTLTLFLILSGFFDSSSRWTTPWKTPKTRRPTPWKLLS